LFISFAVRRLHLQKFKGGVRANYISTVSLKPRAAFIFSINGRLATAMLCGHSPKLNNPISHHLKKVNKGGPQSGTYQGKF